MFEQLKRLGSDTAIYGVSTILGRFLNFLLVPLYTNILVPGEYGIVAYVYSLIAFLTIIYGYGMETAYFKYSSSLEIGTPAEIFSTPFLSLAASSIVFSAFLALASPWIAPAIGLPAGHHTIVLYTAMILALDAAAIVPFAALRHERKAVAFAAVKFTNIVVNVGMNILLLVGFRQGIEGIFLSGIAASGVTLLLLLPTLRRHCIPSWHRHLWHALVRYGLPTVPSGLAAMAIQVIDRPILRALTDDATVGIYQANYRLGIFMMLIVSMYEYAWRPFFFATAKEPNAREIFARVLTYLVLFMGLVFIVLTLFIGDIVRMTLFGRSIIHPDYWPGLGIVPVVLLGYVFLGISTNLAAGMYIEKRTDLLPVNTLVGAVVNIAANFLLIPLVGIMGAAMATLLAYFTMMVMMYRTSRKIYPVSYEHTRLATIACAAAGVLGLYGIFTWLVFPSLYSVLIGVIKVALVILFIAVIIVMKFFSPAERSLLRSFFTGGR